MKHITFSRKQLIKRSLYLLVSVVLVASFLGTVLTRASDNETGAKWASPDAVAIKRVSRLSDLQGEPNFLNNLDCSPTTYRLVAGSTMQTGCFTETAFGLLDSSNGVAIFNGTDEGLPLLPYTPHQVLVPWPMALDLISLDAVNTGGSSISLYKNPLTALRDQRDVLGQLTSKQLIVPPDLPLKDPSGKPLVINPQTIGFSDGGSWLVAETLGGSFVRINLATLDTTAFAPAYGSQGSPALLKSRVAISEDGRFVAIANDVATEFKVYDLATCKGFINNLQPQACQSHDYRPFAQQQIPGLQSIGHLRFINDGLLSFEVSSNTPATNGVYELAPTGSITSLTDYIGMGDSYTSGEGAFDYLSGTDTPDNTCHLSRNSYPLLLTQDLFGSSGGHSVACSGAVINDVGSTSNDYHGQVREVPDWQRLQESQPLLIESVLANFTPGFMAQQRFIGHWQPRIATVSIGGNDIGFGNILQSCVEPHINRHTNGNTCYNTYEDRLELTRLIDRTVPRWIALYKQLQREAPGMQMYAIGYPQIAIAGGNCATNVQLNWDELGFAASLTDYLDQNIRKAAVAAGVPYVDIAQALAGHRLCETASYNVAVNGLTAGTDAGFLGVKVFGKESYHPNALGQSLIEQAILKQTHDLTGSIPSSEDSSGVGNQDFLSVPKTGRTINTVVPDSNLASGLGKRGQSTAVHASGVSDGLRPATTYTVHLDGSAGSVLATLVSDTEGNINGSVTIPLSTTPGGHTIDVTGENQNGDPVDVTQPIYVPTSDTDSDGDGIDDMLDPCPGAVNSGRDNDGDGIDDICDNLIGPTAGSGGTGVQHGSRDGNSTTGTVAITTRSGSGPSVTPPASATGTFTPVKKYQNGRVLGANINRAAPGSPRGKPASDSQSIRRRNLPLLRTIYWLPWLILAIVLWLTLLAAEKYTQKAAFRLQ